MKYIKDQENLKDKVVLLRLDLNVPLKNRMITDETRINKILPVINFLIKKKSKILIISHVGRPKGKIKKSFHHTSYIIHNGSLNQSILRAKSTW